MNNTIGIILCIMIGTLIGFFGYMIFEKKKGDGQTINKLKKENDSLKDENNELRVIRNTYRDKIFNINMGSANVRNAG